MSYQVLIGERKSLVFPVMCYGYLTVDYDDEIAGQNYGLFGHDDSITLQAIITPYDINGFGHEYTGLDNAIGEHGIVDSVKTLPARQARDDSSSALYYRTNGSISNEVLEARTQRYNYLTPAAALTHEMTIFYNEVFHLSLLNATSVHTNQPAEYKLRLRVAADGVVDTLTSDIAISADFELLKSADIGVETYHSSSLVSKYKGLAQIESSGNSGVSGNTIKITGGTNTDELFYVDQKLYTLSGQTFTHAATVASVGTNVKTFTVDSSPTHSLTNDAIIYTEIPKEALYLESAIHIAASFNPATGRMAVFRGGNMIANKVHSAAPISQFQLAGQDSYIGAKITGESADANASDRQQFMGELHELSISGNDIQSFLSTETLIPQYSDLLLYFRFEEVDL